MTVLAQTMQYGGPSRRVRGLTVAALPLPLLVAGSARAEDDARAQARRHFARGVELASEGAYAEAVVEFGRAYELSPHYSVLYNIGQAYIALGRPVEAVDTLGRYISEGGANVPAERRSVVAAEIERLRARIAELEITTDIPNATIWIDGIAIGKAPLGAPARVGIGRHHVVAQSEHGVRAERVIQVAGEERRRLTLDAAVTAVLPRAATPMAEAPASSPPVERAPSPVPAPAPVGESSRAQSTFGYVLGGVGLALGGAALGHFLWNKGRYDDWQARHAQLSKDPDKGAQDENNALAMSIERASVVTVGLAVGAGVAFGSGVVLIVTDPPPGRQAGGFVAWQGTW